MIPIHEFKSRHAELKASIAERGMQEIDIKGDGNCFYRSVSFGLYGTQNKYEEIRTSVADYIEKQGSELINLLDLSAENSFEKYVKALREPGNYDFVGEDTAMAVANIYKCEVHIHSAYIDVQVYKPENNLQTNRIIRMAFFEPNHFQALQLISTNPEFPRPNEIIQAGNILQGSDVRESLP